MRNGVGEMFYVIVCFVICLHFCTYSINAVCLFTNNALHLQMKFVLLLAPTGYHSEIEE